MEHDLEEIYENLKQIQIALRKLGPSKRLKYKDNVKDKIQKARILHFKYKDIVELVTLQRDSSDLTGYIYQTLIEKIESIYELILKFNVELEKDFDSTMDKFDLKAAASLIPVMDGTDEVTERIINGIDMYNSCLPDDNSRKLLISFVLKTRLSKLAQLKIKSKYDNVDALISDMRNYLLTKKSANSLLIQLNNIAQGEMSVTDYGSKIEQLFADLTISQADNNSSAYEILRPINESIAIKKFADGLRNRRLSTIIAARNFDSLKKAVRAAEDEDLAQPNSGVVLNYKRGKPRNSFRGRTPAGRPGPRQRGQGHRGPGNTNNYNNNYNGYNPNNSRARGPYRGRRSYRSYRGYRGQGQERYQHNVFYSQNQRNPNQPGQLVPNIPNNQVNTTPINSEGNPELNFFRV